MVKEALPDLAKILLDSEDQYKKLSGISRYPEADIPERIENITDSCGKWSLIYKDKKVSNS